MMTAETTPMRHLVLWSLLACGGEAAQKDLKPALGKPDRDALVKAGLVRVARGPRNAVLVELTDKGWAWCSRNADAPLPARSTAGTEVLATLLRRLGAWLAATGTPLAEFIRPSPSRSGTPTESAAPSQRAEPEDDHDVPARIRAAYLAATGGALHRPVRLAELRAALPRVSRQALDAGLRALARDGGNLLPQEDPTRIGPDDAAAAMPHGGQARHLLWLTR